MIRIVSDSTASISQNEAEKLNIDIVPLYVLIGGEIYKDGVDLTDDEFYTLLRKHEGSTSQPTPADFLDVFDKYPDDEIICITLSNKLSGTYQSANIAKSMSDNKKINIIDSENISLGLKNLILLAIKMRDEGASSAEIINEISKAKTRIMTLGMADTLENLKRGGRVSNVKFLAGNLLNIKPMLIVKNGVLQSYNKRAMGKRRAINILVKSLTNLKYDNSSDILIGYTQNIENAVLLSQALDKKEVKTYDKDFSELGSVIANHTGENAFILSFFAKE